ncbi:MAG: ribbon-helix-helix protein, CopG family [Deltaproteobacteria bacterium]|nr:ribbon-helix-helix protein, CopG family [Deltaproteobacteria bacterium]
MATTVKVAISIPADELASIDSAARKRKTTRSELIRTAVARVLAEEAERDCRKRIDDLFSDPDVIRDQRQTAEQMACDFGGAEETW